MEVRKKDGGEKKRRLDAKLDILGVGVLIRVSRSSRISRTQRERGRAGGREGERRDGEDG